MSEERHLMLVRHMPAMRDASRPETASEHLRNALQVLVPIITAGQEFPSDGAAPMVLAAIRDRVQAALDILEDIKLEAKRGTILKSHQNVCTRL